MEDKAIKPVETGEVVNTDPISLDPTHLVKANQWEDFVGLWMTSREVDIRNQWFKGDIVSKISAVYGETGLRKFAQEVHESLSMINHYRRVSKAFPKHYRELNLTWNHFLVASFTDSFKKKENDFESSMRFKWIEKAHDEGWSSVRLAEEIKKVKGVKLPDIQDNELQHYLEYIEKIENILTHIDKRKLNKAGAQKIIERFSETQNKIAEYFSDIVFG